MLVYLGEEIGLPAHERVLKLLPPPAKGPARLAAKSSTGVYLADGDV